MKNLQRFILSLAALLLFSGVALVAPVSARDGGSSGSDDTTTTSSSSGSSEPAELENEARNLTETFRKDAKAEIEQKRAAHKQQSQEHRQKACEARKANLDRRMSNAVAHAKKHKATFDKIYTRIKDFHDSKQLKVDNYADLTAKVDAAQTNADAAITVLSQLNVQVDCTQSNVADSVSTFQQAVKTSRDSLKSYRKALVELITSLKGASTANNTSGSNDSGTEQ